MASPLTHPARRFSLLRSFVRCHRGAHSHKEKVGNCHSRSGEAAEDHGSVEMPRKEKDEEHQGQEDQLADENGQGFFEYDVTGIHGFASGVRCVH